MTVEVLHGHAVRYVGSSKGKHRTVFYGYCTCGQGTTNSASPASVVRKLAAHAAGDDRGMFQDARA